MRSIVIFQIIWTTLFGLPPFDRHGLMPKSLRRKLCESHGDLAICHLEVISHSTDKNENILKWTLCKDHPELLLCQWSGLNSSFTTVYHDTKIIQKTGNTEGPQSSELKENSHEKLFTQVIPQATSFKWTEELENLREWEEELNRREKETQTNIEYSSQREEITDQSIKSTEEQVNLNEETVGSLDEDIIIASRNIFE